VSTQTFEEWQATIDRYVGRVIGLSIHDLPDQPYRDWYDGEVTAKEAAREIVESALNGDF
jgi:hypothetical protein